MITDIFSSHATDHPYMENQPVWLANGSDQRAFIIRTFVRGIFGGWHIDCTPENDPAGPFQTFNVNEVMDAPPKFSARGYTGKFRIRDNGAVLREVQGGFV